MSRWTHRICRACWERREGDRRPVTAGLPLEPAVSCCFCEAATTDGIYVREAPDAVRCGGACTT